MTDPVLETRARIARLANIGQRVGYTFLGAAIVLFFVGFGIGFDDTIVTIFVACMIAASVLLVPTIILGYAVRAAEREEAESP